MLISILDYLFYLCSCLITHIFQMYVNILTMPHDFNTRIEPTTTHIVFINPDGTAFVSNDMDSTRERRINT